MEYIKTRGIVARRKDYGEANCILTVFTDKLGTVSATVYGVKSGKNKMRAAAQQLCFSEFVLVKKQGEIYRVESADIIESFYPISEDFVKLSLAAYFLELVNDVFSEEDKSILSLLLNSLYVLAYKDIDMKLLKAVFEIKLMQYSGYTPEINHCVRCGEEAEPFAFSKEAGVVCRGCASFGMMKINRDALRAVEYILSSDNKQLFGFDLSDEVLEMLSQIGEKYLLDKSDKSYKSLDYYKKMKN